ncbi:MAG: single-stranded-DNA-specific exonuclease RecJ [Spirochaetaceae bacterium 4572_59]|nr:MAG: single-stranded-DNA-specific exonuclease RecJ [Spirochaetaceae bacterium 4572_59]
MKWNKKNIDPAQLRLKAEKMHIDLLQASILMRREVAEEDFLYFLEDDLRYLHNSFLFRQMVDAVDRVHAAVAEEEKILICGDRDVDGITSTVLLYEALKDASGDVDWRVPVGDESYGLNQEVIKEFAAQDGTLIFCVDCGISDYREIELAGSLGIDVIVLDHHIPREGDLPNAFAIINPKVKEDTYPFDGLAGCGVVAKFIWALSFSRTELYNQGYCFFYVDVEKQQLEIYKYVNLLETERKIYPLDQQIPLDDLSEMLRGWILFTYGIQEQQEWHNKIFAKAAEVQIVDLAGEICRDFPSLTGRTFRELRDNSRYARYSSEEADNGQAFLYLFSGLMLKRYNKEFELFINSLDLVALGTLADLMPLHNENRILIRKGVPILMRAVRPGLRELFIRQRLLGRTLETSDISWLISPWINSAGRMGKANLAVELLITDDSGKRETLADEMHSLNQERKKLGDSLWEEAAGEARSQMEQFHNKLVLISHLPVPRGLTGIVASRMVNSFNVPAIILSKQEDGSLSGSVRSMKDCPVRLILASMSDLFTDFGGHDCAAGFSMEGDKEELFRKRLVDFTKTWDPGDREEAIPEVDAEIPEKFLSPDLWDMVSRMEPYGDSFKPFVFLSKGLLVEKADLIGKEPQNHLKFLLSSKEGKFPALYWNGAEKFQDFMRPDNRVNLLYHIKRNYYMNKESLQLVILDMEPAQ